MIPKKPQFVTIDTREHRWILLTVALTFFVMGIGFTCGVMNLIALYDMYDLFRLMILF